MRAIKLSLIVATLLIFLQSFTACQEVGKGSMKPLDQTAEENLVPGRPPENGVPVLTAMAYSTDTGYYHNACSGGQSQAVMGNEWTYSYFDTDSDYGDCEFYFFVRDYPGDVTLTPASLVVDFQPMPNAHQNECRNPGEHEIVIWTRGGNPSLTPMILATDDEPGGCTLTFKVKYQNDIGLDIRYTPGDNGVEQCINRTGVGKHHTASLNKPVTIGLDLDKSDGGCALQLRLRKL